MWTTLFCPCDAMQCDENLLQHIASTIVFERFARRERESMAFYSKISSRPGIALSFIIPFFSLDLVCWAVWLLEMYRSPFFGRYDKTKMEYWHYSQVDSVNGFSFLVYLSMIQMSILWRKRTKQRWWREKKTRSTHNETIVMWERSRMWKSNEHDEQIKWDRAKRPTTEDVEKSEKLLCIQTSYAKIKTVWSARQSNCLAIDRYFMMLNTQYAILL